MDKVNHDVQSCFLNFLHKVPDYAKHHYFSHEVSQDKSRVHIATWDALAGLNRVSLSTFVQVYFSPALTHRSNLLPADLCCLSNPAS